MKDYYAILGVSTDAEIEVINAAYRAIAPFIPANVKVIAAGSESQMASWEQDSSHSLFTKYFLKAMSGEGDSNKDGKVSDAELKEYLSDTMTYYARRYYGRDQKVQIHNGG